MKNAEEKQFSISEFAKACGTTKDTLYHYEKQELLVPSYDDNNHYRLYSAKDFHLFQYIAHLRRMGFSVAEIKDNIADRNVKTYLEMLTQSQKQCLDKITDLNHRYDIITNSLETVSQFTNIPLETPAVKYAEEEYFYESHFTGKFQSLDGIRQIQDHLKTADKMPDVTGNITVFRVAGKSIQEGFSPRFSIMVQTSNPDAVKKEMLHTKPAGSYLQMYFTTDVVSSSEEDTAVLLRRMKAYAEEHNYRITTDYYCFLHISTFLTDDPKEYLTEFLVGIE